MSLSRKLIPILVTVFCVNDEWVGKVLCLAGYKASTSGEPNYVQRVLYQRLTHASTR